MSCHFFVIITITTIVNLGLILAWPAALDRWIDLEIDSNGIDVRNDDFASDEARVLNFFPVPVEEECLSEDKRRRGICMNTYECRIQQGQSHGRCALGFGVCCIFFIISIIALNLTTYNAKSQEKSKKFDDVPNENISAGLQQTLERLDKMTNEEKLNALIELTYCANNFSLNLYKTYASARRGNFVLSVFPIFQLMGPMAWGSTGYTKRQIHRVLKLPPNKRRIFEGFEEIHRRFEEENDAWYSANSLWIPEDSPVTSDFKILRRRIYSVPIISSSSALPGTMIVDSVGIFKCSMGSQKNMYPVMFSNEDGTKTEYENYVRLTGKYRHGRLPEIQATFVEIPCEQKRRVWGDESKVESTRMFILLPDRTNGLDELERNIGSLSINKLSTGELHDVNVTVPLRYEYTFDNITDSLTRLGLTEMFSENAEIFLTATQNKFRWFRNYGSLKIEKNDNVNIVPGIINENICKVIIDRPFINVITTTDKNPLILHMARITSLEDE